MPECGWSPKPLNGTPLLSKRSRKTNGFRTCPKSDGLIRRVIGPWLWPRVRRAIRRWGLRAIDAERVIGNSPDFRRSGRDGGRQEVADRLAGALDAAGGRLGAHLQALDVDEGDVETDEAQHRP